MEPLRDLVPEADWQPIVLNAQSVRQALQALRPWFGHIRAIHESADSTDYSYLEFDLGAFLKLWIELYRFQQPTTDRITALRELNDTYLALGLLEHDRAEISVPQLGLVWNPAAVQQKIDRRLSDFRNAIIDFNQTPQLTRNIARFLYALEPLISCDVIFDVNFGNKSRRISPTLQLIRDIQERIQRMVTGQDAHQ